MRYEKRYQKVRSYIEQLEYNHTVSESGKEWLYNSGYGVVTPDFKGYLFEIDPWSHVGAAISIDCALSIFSTDPKRVDLPFRKFKKALNYLIRTGFLIPLYDDVFPELMPSLEIPFNEESAHKVDRPIFESLNIIL